MNQVRNSVLISCALKRSMFISSTTISAGLRSSPTVDRNSLNIFMSLSILRFALKFFISVVSVCCMFLVCHVCLRVTITSSTQAKINGYLPRALIWIGHYHTCKKVRITYKYVINVVTKSILQKVHPGNAQMCFCWYTYYALWVLSLISIGI